MVGIIAGEGDAVKNLITDHSPYLLQGFDHLSAESRQVLRLPRCNEVAVHGHLLIDIASAGVHHVYKN